MDNLKRKISLILSVMMLSLTILPLFVVNAAGQIAYTLKLDGTKMVSGNGYEVVGGETITFSASSSTIDVGLVGYYFDDDDSNITEVYGTSTKIKVPNAEPGTLKKLRVAASGYDAGNNVIREDWETYYLEYVEEESTVVTGKDLVLKYGSKTLVELDPVVVEHGDKLTLSAKPSAEVVALYYAWGTGKWMQINASTGTITVPSSLEVGEQHYLYVNAKYSDGTYADREDYIIEIKDNTVVANKDVTLKYGSKTLAVNSTTEVEVGDFLTASATPAAEVVELYYAWDSDAWRVFYKATGSIEVPDFAAGSTHTLRLIAKYSDGEYSDGETYKIKIKDEVVVINKAMTVSYENVVLKVGSTTTANPGESIKIAATPSANVTKIYFKWDNESWAQANGVSSYSTRIPTTFAAGSTHTLTVKALYNDGSEIAEQKYTFKIPATAANITMNVKLDSTTISTGKTYQVVGGEDLDVIASVTNSSVSKIKYHFGSDAEKSTNKSTLSLQVPVQKAGTTLKFYVEAIAADGTTTGVKTYTFEFAEEADDDKLKVEPWMEVNDELVELAVNLRNDSLEEDKANKNIYELNEVVTYYVDYKNGTGDDVDTEVGLVLELPLAFTVVDADGGAVSTKNKTITWEFPDGLEEDAEGTKTVKVKYTAFTKSKYDCERIYPSAIITKGSKAKEQDRSTVINLIVVGYAEEIDVEHEPYMFGDEHENTFRPDDSISRAEGALVLARIYGLNYNSTKVTNVFSDLGDTYVEAQKAIIAATKAGLISGYTDGTFRPNAKMTRAEFMKILACMIEKQAADDEIEGLEVKDLENSIKVYADSTRYYIVDGKKIYSHWALEEVSLLARLNMTPLSEDEDEIELDEEITRAEVAQLVNFYLLRAPANVTSKTKSGFDDVSKKHDLFADIIEATREAHTFSMEEEDGTETAE